MASTTAASGAPNVADMPAAAPAASRILRSDGDTRMTWPSSEPIAPPVTMIGPSAPNGAPVPMAMAAEIGLAIAVRGAMRLCLVSTASIASGMPWPRITRRPPGQQADEQARRATAATNSGRADVELGERRRVAADHWWNSATLVMRAMRCSSTQAAPPPASPGPAARHGEERRAGGCEVGVDHRPTIVS